MSNTMSAQSSDTKPSLERSGIRRIVQVLVSVLIIGVLLFSSAGRLDWLWAWLFLAGWLLLYRYVRHPMYVGTIFFGLSIPLFLGSWWTFIPCGLIVVLFIIRAALEDKTLQEELPGYAEYAERVRYRLLPGVW